jgi:hypothetical protein
MRLRIPEWLSPPATRVRSKVRRMSVEDIGRWTDVAGSEMSQAMAQYVATRDAAALAELERGVATLVAVVEELRARRD